MDDTCKKAFVNGMQVRETARGPEGKLGGHSNSFRRACQTSGVCPTARFASLTEHLLALGSTRGRCNLHIAEDAAVHFSKLHTFHTKPVLHQKPFTPDTFYARNLLHQTFLHQTSFTPKAFYTKHLLFQTPLTLNNIYTRHFFARDASYTEHFFRQLLHQTTCTLFTPGTFTTFFAKHLFTTNVFYTTQLLHQTPLAPDSFYTRDLLHQTPFTPETFTPETFFTLH